MEDDEPGAKCPELGLPNRPVEGGGRPNMETYPVQGHILRIDRETLPSGARVINIDGQVVEPQRHPNGEIVRQGWEKDISQAAEGMWIPSSPLPNYPEGYRGLQAYDGSHLWGPVLGTEAREGILLAPASVNRGIQSEIETYLQTLQQRVTAEGGYVLVQARMETYAPGDWTQGHPMAPTGTNLVRSVNYDVFVCDADGNIQNDGQWGYDVGLPTGSRITENFRAGEVSNIRRGVPIPTPP